jgi:membrane associated rhomboid family serine protease
MNETVQRPPTAFGFSMSPLTRKLLIVYASIYVVQLLMQHWFRIPLTDYLVVHPAGSDDFRFWQIFTHPFVHDPNSPIIFLIDCLVFYFFANPVQYMFGSRGFLFLFYFSALGAFIAGFACSLIPGFAHPFSGMSPSIISLIVVFGLLNPEAVVYLMFIIPLKAKYISYGTVVVVAVTFLAKANPNGAWHLGGILFGYLFLRGPRNVLDPSGLYQRYLMWRFERKKRRFTVYEGGKSDKNDEKPTIH